MISNTELRLGKILERESESLMHIYKNVSVVNLVLKYCAKMSFENIKPAIWGDIFLQIVKISSVTASKQNYKSYSPSSKHDTLTRLVEQQYV